jgi:hypothetical protein
MPTLETAGPNHIEVQQFGGFGPMGVNAWAIGKKMTE